MTALLPLDRQLDELICEKVLGWRRPTRPNDGEPWYIPVSADVSVPVSAQSVPHFTTRMEDAWRLATHLRASELYPGRRRDFELFQADRVDHGMWVCRTQATPDDLHVNGQEVAVKHERPEMAICIATLEAFRVLAYS